MWVFASVQVNRTNSNKHKQNCASDTISYLYQSRNTHTPYELIIMEYGFPGTSEVKYFFTSVSCPLVRSTQWTACWVFVNTIMNGSKSYLNCSFFVRLKVHLTQMHLLILREFRALITAEVLFTLKAHRSYGENPFPRAQRCDVLPISKSTLICVT